MDDNEVRIFGKYIVADPRICHGQLTFRGTRVFVADVLDQVAYGEDWHTIVSEWEGTVSLEAIAEAVQLARDALLEREEQRRPESVAG
jgi:uncharacterized protein (DUF433 family)